MTPLEITLLVCLLVTFLFLIRNVFRLRSKIAIWEDEQSKTGSLYVTDQLSMTIVCNSRFMILDVLNPKETILLKVPITDLIGFNARKLEQVVWRKFRKQARMLMSSLQKTLDTKNNYYTEYALEVESGKRFYVFFLFEYISDDKICCHITTLDAFSLYREREQLKETNLNLKLALDTSLVSVWKYDVEIDRFGALVGDIIAQEGTSYDDCYRMLHPDSREEYARIFDYLKSGKSERESCTFHFYDAESGTENYFLSQMIADRSNSGRVLRIIGTQKDVTEEYYTKRELEQKYNLLEAIHENIPIGMSLFSEAGICTTTNKYGFDILGLTSSDQYIGHYSILNDPNMDEDVKKAIRENRSASLLRSYNTKGLVQFSSVFSDHQERLFDYKIVPLNSNSGEINGFLVLYSDVTDFMSNAQKMEELAVRYEAMFCSISSGIEITNNDGRTMTCNDSVYSLFGVIDRDEYLSEKRSIIDNPNLSEENVRKFKSGEEFTAYIDYDFDLVNRKGFFKSSRSGKAIIELKYTPMVNKDGEVIGAILLSSDVTENMMLNKRYEDLYRQQEALLALLPVGVYIYDKEGILIYQNLVGQQLIGSGDLKNKINLFENPNLGAGLIEAIQSGVNVKVQLEYDFDRIVEFGYHPTDKKGIRYIDMKTTVVQDDQGDILYYPVVYQDVSEEVYNKQKLEETNLKLKMVVNTSSITPWDYDCSTQRFFFYIDSDSYFRPSMSLDEFINFIHPDDQAKANEAFGIMSLGKNETFQFELRYKLNEVEDWNFGVISGQPYVYQKDGSVMKYTGWRKDTSDWKRLTNQLVQMNRQNKLILDNTHSGFIFFTLDYMIQWENVSTTFEGYPIAENYRTGLICYRDLKGLDAPCPGCVLNEAILKKKITQKEVCVQNKYFVEMIVTPVFNENGDGLEGVVMRVDNITERKLINIELKEAKEKAEQSNQLKSAFLANMSHEIRTPLNAIVGFSDIALSADSEEEKAEYKKIIQTNSELLINLINDILDLSKIESGYLEMNSDTVDFALLFNEIKTSFSMRMNPGVELICQNPFETCVVSNIDKQRMLQVITNFISNAIKFTSKGSITIGYNKENIGLKIFVKDTGIGISEENKKKVFHRFQKFDTFAQGTGLGLSICRAIVEAMGGQIGFESAEGRGSTFWALIPCKIIELEQSQSIVIENNNIYSIKGKAMEQIRILVAEDNNSNFLLLRAILKGYNLSRAINGLEAVEMAKNEHFDLILMDIKMPEMNGLEATTEIRKFNPSIPIIALTANAFDSDKEEAFKAGCNDFLTKPLNKDALFKAIQAM